MSHHRSGCFICGKDLVYFDGTVSLSCEICGQSFEATAACEDRHFVCDACHAAAGIRQITEIALRHHSTDPIQIANEMMASPFVNMHGPEHHYLVAAALLCASHNAGSAIDLAACLETARRRAEDVPGGVCGMWGCCGAAVSTGIFVSCVTGATPLSVKAWSLANLMTSNSLAAISQNGGPRCCKRNSYLGILAAVDFSAEHLGITLTRPERIACEYPDINPTCKRKSCLFFAS